MAPQDKSILLFEHRPKPSFGLCLSFWGTNCRWAQWYREGEDLSLCLPFGLSWACTTHGARACACAACSAFAARHSHSQACLADSLTVCSNFSAPAIPQVMSGREACEALCHMDVTDRSAPLANMPCTMYLLAILFGSSPCPLLITSPCKSYLTSDFLFYNQIYQLLHYVVLAVALFWIRKEKLTADEYFFRTVPLWGWIWQYM